MPRQDATYASLILPILAVLRAHPDTSFTSEELCQQLGCTPTQVPVALDVLVRARLAKKESSVGGSDRYTWSGTHAHGAAQKHRPA